MSLADRLAQRQAPAAVQHEQPGPKRHGARHADPFGVVKRSVHEALLEAMGPTLYDAHLDQRELEQQVMQTLQAVLQRDETPLTSADRARVAQEVADDILGHGPLERLLADESVTEIMVNGPYDIWVERQGRLYQTTVRFNDDSHLRRIINKMVAQVGRRIDESSPMVDARLPDGSRLNAAIPPATTRWCSLTIRKFLLRAQSLEQLVGLRQLAGSHEETDAGQCRALALLLGGDAVQRGGQ